MLLIILIGLIILTIVLVYKNDGHFNCDYDCYHCPFPECSTEEKEWLKKHMK